MRVHGDQVYVCQHPTHRIARIGLGALLGARGRRFCELPFEVLVDSYNKTPLNSPNVRGRNRRCQ